MKDLKHPERKGRLHATESAARIPKMVKELMTSGLRAHDEGKKLAYTFIGCCYDEIIRAMDIVPWWTENFAGICGAKRVSNLYLERASKDDLSRTLCTYALCGLGFDSWREELHSMPPESPWGGQPKPDMMLGAGYLICDPRYKWYQAAQQYMNDVPMHVTDAPWPTFEMTINHHEEKPYYVKYIISQLRNLIDFLEKETGLPMDYDRLSELVDLSDRTWNLIHDTYELRRALPTPMGTGDAMNTMVPIVFMMGTDVALDFFQKLNDELNARIRRGDGSVPDEKFRLLWGGGLPAWFALSDFDYFANCGASFPAEVTYRVVEPVYNLDIPKTSDPVEHLAWRWVNYWTYRYDKARRRPGSYPDVERLIEYIERYRIDGIVMHEAFSCRSWHAGLIWQLKTLKKVYRDIPSLILESDIVDISTYSETDTHNRIDTFIETLDAMSG